MRSAILVSRLLILLLKTLFGVFQAVDFFRVHFSVHIEIESLLFKIDWKYDRSFHTRSTISHSEFMFPDQFYCGSDSTSHHRVPHRILVVLCT